MLIGFSHLCIPTGAIYLTIQNLPRHEWYKHENVILVGLIPGPKEPKLTANAYLTPLIIELKDFWEGVMIPVKISNTTVHIRTRLALSCVACDIPASRKVCGFLGIAARLGCNKCLKSFLSEKHGNGQKTNYSGFDRNSWQLRSNSSTEMSVQSYTVEALPPNLHYILLKQMLVFAIQCYWICHILIQSRSQLLTQCTTCIWAQQSTCLNSG